MKKIKLVLPLLIVTLFIFTSCSKNDSKNDVEESTTNNKDTHITTTTTTTKEAKENTTKNEFKENDISQKVKEYILNGQNDKPEVDKLKWSKSFLNQVNIEEVYNKYISDNGDADNIETFAKYLTQNAPIQDNWKTLFEKDLLNTYGEKVSKYEPIPNNYNNNNNDDGLYQVYVQKDGSDVPFVVVNSRTGYFHG